jgi:hypothetical protein
MMETANSFHPDEERLAKHLAHLGYEITARREEEVWHYADHPLGPPLCFRAAIGLLRLHEERWLSGDACDLRAGLLDVVNHLNSAHWLLRCSVGSRTHEGKSYPILRLRTNLPIGLPDQEMATYLWVWLRESAWVDKAVQAFRVPFATSSDAGN